jgi:putative Holliday junction resolvase
MKILAVDPGLKRIGIAVSDPTGTAARALETFRRTTLERDCARILETAGLEQAERILVGNSHEQGTKRNEQARFTYRLVAALRPASPLPVTLWDESFSTRSAREARLQRGSRRKERRAADDALAAAAFLQEYLDAQAEST